LCDEEAGEEERAEEGEGRARRRRGRRVGKIIVGRGREGEEEERAREGRAGGERGLSDGRSRELAIIGLSKSECGGERRERRVVLWSCGGGWEEKDKGEAQPSSS